jgi:small subunit ribosomal protein S21
MKLSGRKVEIRDGNIDKALRKWKKKVSETGLLIELRSRETYTKPSVAKKIAREVAKKRWKKHLASQNLPKVSR